MPTGRRSSRSGESPRAAFAALAAQRRSACPNPGAAAPAIVTRRADRRGPGRVWGKGRDVARHETRPGLFNQRDRGRDVPGAGRVAAGAWSAAPCPKDGAGVTTQ